MQYFSGNITLIGPKTIYHDTTVNWIVLLESTLFGTYSPENLFLYRIRLPSRYLQFYGSFDKLSYYSYNSMHFSYDVESEVKIGEHLVNISVHRRQAQADAVDVQVAAGQFQLIVRPFTEMIALHIEDFPHNGHEDDHFVSNAHSAHRPVTFSWNLTTNYDLTVADQLVEEKWTVSRSVVPVSAAHHFAQFCSSLNGGQYNVTLQLKRIFSRSLIGGGNLPSFNRQYTVSRLFSLPLSVSLLHDPEVIDNSASVLVVVSDAPKNTWSGCYLVTTFAALLPPEWENCRAFFNFTGCHHELTVEVKYNGWNYLHVAINDKNDQQQGQLLWTRAKLYKEYEDLR